MENAVFVYTFSDLFAMFIIAILCLGGISFALKVLWDKTFNNKKTK